MDAVTKLLETFVEKKMAAGASALVIKDGKKIYEHAVGYADIEKQTPFCIDSIMRIYSMSKVVTAAAIMALQDEGKLLVSDPVGKYLSNYRHQSVSILRDEKYELVPAEREMTIHDLLTMTSGIAYLSSADNERTGMDWDGLYDQFCKENTARPNTVGFANFLGQFPLAFQPGKRWMYGYSCDVLGGIAEVASGMPFGEYLQKTFFGPLGMHDTRFRVPKEKQTRVSTIYLNTDQGLIPQTPHYDSHDDMPYESGGAGLYSTLPDYARFAQMLLGSGELDGVRCLKEESVRLMTSNRLTSDQSLSYNWDDCPGYGYGYAVRVMTDQSLSCYMEENGSFGWNGAAGTSVRIDPKRDLVVLFGTQVRPPEHAKYLPQLMKAVSKIL